MSEPEEVVWGDSGPPLGPHRSLGQRAFGGMLWMLIGTGGQIFAQVIVLIVLARQISPDDFGVASAAIVVLALSTILADSGLGPAIVQRMDLRPEHIRVAFTVSCLLGLVVWAALIAAAPAVAEFFAIPRLVPVLRVMGAAFFLRSLTVGDHLLERELDFRRLAAAELTALFLGYGTVSIVLALSGAGVWAIVWGHVAWAGIRTALMWWIRPHPWLPSLAREPLRQLVRFGAALTVAQFASVVATQGDNFVVGRWLGPTALGLYGRAYQLMAMPALLFGQVLNKVLFPAMASVQDDKVRLRKAYTTGVAAIAVLTLPLSLVLSFTAEEVILVILGADWLPLLGAFRVLVFCMLFRASYKISDCLALATGAIYRRAARQWVYAGLVVLGSIIGQRWGISGVAVGLGIALVVNYLLMAQLSLRLIDMSWRSLASAHRASASMSLLAAIAAWPAVTVLRGAGAPPAAVLAGTLCAAALIVLVAVRLFPKAPGVSSMVELLDNMSTLLMWEPARRLINRITAQRG